MYHFNRSQEQPKIPFYRDSHTEAFLTSQAQEFLPPIPSNLPGYDRDSRATGVDIKVTPGEDLAVTPNGDLEIEAGSELIQNALARRLATPPHGYRRYLFLGKEVFLLDETYGNPVYTMLSHPNVLQQGSRIASALKEAARLEPRIDKVSVEEVHLEDGGTKIVAQLHYQIKSNEELYQLDLEIQGRG